MLALLFVFTVAGTFAAEIDLSALSDDEIVALSVRVNEEIVSRKLAKSAELPKGTYIVGKDMPSGTYIYTCLAAGDDWGNVTVKNNGKQLLWEIVSAPEDGAEPESFRVLLNDSDELRSDVPFSLTISTGIVFK